MHDSNCIRSDGDWLCSGRCTHFKDAKYNASEKLILAVRKECENGKASVELNAALRKYDKAILEALD